MNLFQNCIHNYTEKNDKYAKSLALSSYRSQGTTPIQIATRSILIKTHSKTPTHAHPFYNSTKY